MYVGSSRCELSWSDICATLVIARMYRMLCNIEYNIESKIKTNRLPQLFRSLLPLDTAVYLHTKHRRSSKTTDHLRCRLRIRRLALILVFPLHFLHVE